MTSFPPEDVERVVAFLTKTGKPLTDEDILVYADEAEEGYPVELWNETSRRKEPQLPNVAADLDGFVVEHEDGLAVQVRCPDCDTVISEDCTALDFGRAARAALNHSCPGGNQDPSDIPGHAREGT